MHALVTDITVTFERDGVARPTDARDNLPQTHPGGTPLIPSVPATYSYHPNDPLPNAALPRAPDQRRQEGRSATQGAIRCPHCDKKLGDRVVGIYETTCPRCKRPVTITR